MKYKVILANTLSSAEVERSANFTFYILNGAIDCAQQWAAYSTSFIAYLWDGTQWRFYE